MLGEAILVRTSGIPCGELILHNAAVNSLTPTPSVAPMLVPMRALGVAAAALNGLAGLASGLSGGPVARSTAAVARHHGRCECGVCVAGRKSRLML